MEKAEHPVARKLKNSENPATEHAGTFDKTGMSVTINLPNT
ncbi:protein of unknown function [Candidatus Nitrospira inopinata]|uniref:Uncharacterized protein n=1 Tax=Candidatus Nitrospira inopinata TaxID=1715989 RepID=A0A0S4KUL6_9BACT|nr:protein of unknown function [Candidatus Nitrospira inopinata]